MRLKKQIRQARISARFQGQKVTPRVRQYELIAELQQNAESNQRSYAPGWQNEIGCNAELGAFWACLQGFQRVDRQRRQPQYSARWAAPLLGGRVPKCPHFVSDFFLWKRPKNAVPGGLSRALANALALLGISFRCVGDRFAARALPPALPSATTSILTSFRFAGIAFNSLAR
jgi:hypothetical protein